MARSILEIIIQTLRRGTGFEDTQKSLKSLDSAAQGINRTLGLFGVAVGAKELVDFANASRAAARAETDSIGALKEAAKGIDDYQKALELGREATKGMASDQQIAASQATLFGAGLATTAEQVAQLSSAGTVLSQIFASAGASEELFVRLLSSGSVALYNNFGLTTQMVEAKQKEIETTRGLTGEEAKQQALKEVLIEQAQKYQSALSNESVAAAQAQAAQANFIASFGQLINAMDQATGATDFATAALNKLTEGAKAWQVIIEQQIPAIQQHEAAMAAQAAQTILTSESYDELEAATDDAAKNQEAFQQALLRNVDTHTEYQAAVDKVAQSNLQMAGELDLTAEEFVNLKNAMVDAVVSSGQWVSSLNAMNIVAAQTVQKTIELTQAQRELANQASVQADAFGGQQDSFTQQRNLAALRQVGDKRLQYQEEQRRAEEEATRQSEQNAKKQAQAMVKAFDQVGQQISSAVSSAISENNSDVIGKLLGLDNAEQNAGEAVRRMAAVAAGGIKDQWADDLAAQLSGVQNATAQAFVKAFQSGDEGGLKAAAQQLALNPIVEMFDATLIANQIEQQLRAQQLQQQLNDKVNALLGERGLQAVSNVTQQIAGVAADTGAATTAVGESVTGLGTSAEDSGAKIGAAFTAAIGPVDTLNSRLKLMAGLIERVNTLAGQAAGNIAGMNPPAAPGPTDAQNKMGGNAPL